MNRIISNKTRNRSLKFLLFAFLGIFAAESMAQTIINNGKMRFGNGSENSINNTGNLQQPFYYSTAISSWRSLTYSSQPLSQSLAFGGDGTNEWNNNGTVVTNMNLVNQVIQNTDFDYDSGTSGTGIGTLVSTGQYTVGSNVIKTENTYTMGASSFITIKTKITNMGTQNVLNLRYWIGTNDDYVGGMDNPTKERGNLVDGSFQLITTQAEQAKALRIKTGNEGVLFFSSSDRAYNIIGQSYGWQNVLDRNPALSPITITHDGSYGMYVRMNDLAPGQSDEFIWYYAAAKLSELDDLVGEVAAAAGGLGNVTCNSAVYEAESTTAGTGYLMTVADGSAAPTAAQIKAGIAYGGVTPLSAISQAMIANVEYELDITGLAPNTTYQAYFVVENTSAVFTDVMVNNITTAGNPEITFSPTAANCLSSGDGALTASASNGTEPFVFQWTDGPEAATYTGLDAGSYEVQVTDANNCQATASGTVGISDVVPPVANAKNISVYLDSDGQATLTGDMVDDGSTDNCELDYFTISATTVNCTNLSNPVSIIMTAFDAAGNSHFASAQVVVLDTLKPVLSAQNVELVLDANGEASLVAGDVDNGSTDNCGIQSLSLSQYTFSCLNLGDNDVVLTAQDASGNQQSVTVVVSVIDNAAPIVQTQNVTVYLNASATAFITLSDVIVSESDNCGISQRVLDKTTFDCGDLDAPVLVTLSVKDASDNETQNAISVTVLDTISPMAAPQNIEVALDANGEVSFTAGQVATMIGAGSSDNCSDAALIHSLSEMHFTCADMGENTVTYAVHDASMNVASAQIIISVIDNSNPVALASEITLYLDANGEASLDAEAVDNGSSDNCGIQTAAVSKSVFSCEDIGNQTVQYTVTDASGNSAEVDFTVTVRDILAPTATLVQNHILYLDAEGETSVTVQDILLSHYDNCGIAMETLSKTEFDCSNVGVNSISLLVEDNYGNNTFVAGTITVADTLKPTFSLSSIDLVLNDEGVASLTPSMLQPYVGDNCGIAEIAIQKQSFSCQNAQQANSTEVLIYDLNGNAFQKTLHVNLIDNVKPMVEVEDFTLILNHDGLAQLSIFELDFREMENCGIAQRTLSQTQFSCADLGASQVQITVTDFAGNQGTANFTVNVVDIYAPKMESPVLIEMCEGVFEAPVIRASDNCSTVITQSAGPASGAILTAATYSLEYTATDPSGNTTVATVTLIVHPSPVVDLGGDMIIEAGELVNLSAGNEVKVSYLWSTGETTPGIFMVPLKSKTVWVKATSAFGCVAYDEIRITVQYSTGVNDAEDDGSLSIYPNPATSAISIALAGNVSIDGTATIHILDLNGKVVFSEQTSTLRVGQPHVLNISDLAKGVYIVNILSDKINMSQRIVKQ